MKIDKGRVNLLTLPYSIRKGMVWLMSNTGYIYMIENRINKKKYIGQTNDAKTRKIRHWCNLRNNQHINNHLQNSWNKYGKKNFRFKIIEENIPLDELDDRERYWIKYYDTYEGEGYNFTSGGNVLRGEENPFYGKKHTEETKKIMSIKAKGHKRGLGRKLSKKTKEKLSKKHTGKKLSEETKRKISKATKGKNNPFYGCTHTEETIGKISGENHYKSQGSFETSLLLIEEAKDRKMTIKELSVKYNLSPNVVRNICNGEHWTTRHISKEKLPNINGYAVTIEEAINILKDRKKYFSLSDLAKKYDISGTTAGTICIGEHPICQEIDFDYSQLPRSVNQHKKEQESPITVNIAKKILKDRAKGLLYKELKDKYKISMSVISKILNNKHWTNQYIK